MPDKTLAAYKWLVSNATDSSSFTVEAAYPVIDDGHMLLKDSEHKIVFAAAPGAGCTFTRGEAAATAPAAAPALNLLPVKFPDGCTCTYLGTASFGPGAPAMRWDRNVNWSCKADHTATDAVAVITAGNEAPARNPSPAPGCCTHNFPLTVRCHECTPVTVAETGTRP